MPIPAILLAAVLALGVARADHGCQTTEPTATLETPVGTYYVVNDACQPDCLFSVWIYQESNGEPGLQRCEDPICPTGCDLLVF